MLFQENITTRKKLFLCEGQWSERVIFLWWCFSFSCNNINQFCWL